MNERIRELALQAGCKVMDDGDWYIPSAKGLEKIVYTKGIGLEKFAELIVKECISISESHAKNLESQPCDPNFEQYEDGIVNGIYEATAAIKEHFGVSE